MANKKVNTEETTGLQSKSMKVRLTFLEEVLGTSSNDPELHDNFIASKAPDALSRAEEIEALGVGEVVEKSMTVFPQLKDGTPFVYDYQIKGFFKDTCSALRKVKGSCSSKIKAYKKEIDGLVFIDERKIPFQNYGRIGECQRPLRGSTPQGERIALAHSETVPEGTFIEFTIVCYETDKYDLMQAVCEWLNFGVRRGLGQWRNSGKGRFKWEEITD